MKNPYIIISGIINLLTAFIHLIGGQIDLINPMVKSNLNLQQKGELLGVWHMITLFLFYTTIIIFKHGMSSQKAENSGVLKFIGMTYLLFSLPFIICSIWYWIFAPQWVLLFPIGILILLGLKKSSIEKND